MRSLPQSIYNLEKLFKFYFNTLPVRILHLTSDRWRCKNNKRKKVQISSFSLFATAGWLNAETYLFFSMVFFLAPRRNTNCIEHSITCPKTAHATTIICWKHTHQFSIEKHNYTDNVEPFVKPEIYIDILGAINTHTKKKIVICKCRIQ